MFLMLKITLQEEVAILWQGAQDFFIAILDRIYCVLSYSVFWSKLFDILHTKIITKWWHQWTPMASFKTFAHFDALQIPLNQISKCLWFNLQMPKRKLRHWHSSNQSSTKLTHRHQLCKGPFTYATRKIFRCLDPSPLPLSPSENLSILMYASRPTPSPSEPKSYVNDPK